MTSLPFSHLTSPSVTDSANAGVLTVTISFPVGQKQMKVNTFVQYCILYLVQYKTYKRLKHTVGYRCPEVLDLEDTGSGITFSEEKRKFYTCYLHLEVFNKTQITAPISSVGKLYLNCESHLV